MKLSTLLLSSLLMISMACNERKEPTGHLLYQTRIQRAAVIQDNKDTSRAILTEGSRLEFHSVDGHVFIYTVDSTGFNSADKRYPRFETPNGTFQIVELAGDDTLMMKGKRPSWMRGDTIISGYDGPSGGLRFKTSPRGAIIWRGRTISTQMYAIDDSGRSIFIKSGKPASPVKGGNP